MQVQCGKFLEEASGFGVQENPALLEYGIKLLCFRECPTRRANVGDIQAKPG